MYLLHTKCRSSSTMRIKTQFITLPNEWWYLLNAIERLFSSFILFFHHCRLGCTLTSFSIFAAAPKERERERDLALHSFAVDAAVFFLSLSSCVVHDYYFISDYTLNINKLTLWLNLKTFFNLHFVAILSYTNTKREEKTSLFYAAHRAFTLSFF